MSFYGSRYYQATDAFAKFLIKNSGLNKTDFLTETPPSSVEIEADGRASELNLDSGNRWIQLKGSDEENKCTIYHEKANFNTDTFINIINNIETPEENDDRESIIYPDKETILNVEEGVRFSIPLIYYDEAGHISMPIKEDGSVSQLIQTFVIPKISSATEIDIIKEDIKEIQKKNEEQDKSINKNTTDISSINNAIEGINNNVTNALLQASEANSKSDNAIEQINQTNTTINAAISGLSAKIDSLIKRVEDLENK